MRLCLLGQSFSLGSGKLLEMENNNDKNELGRKAGRARFREGGQVVNTLGFAVQLFCGIPACSESSHRE